MVCCSCACQDRSATATFGDYDSDARSITIPTGQSSVTIQTEVYGDVSIEGNETFDLIVLASTNATLPDGAAALVATATIYDNDDGIGDPAPGVGGLADRIMGPDSASLSLPTITAYGVVQAEGNSSYEYARFLVMLDEPATATVTINYYFQDGSASARRGDYDSDSGSFTIAAGQQSTWISTEIYGDSAIEADETFQLVLWSATNAVFSGNAAALTATATILDDDGGALSTTAGIGAEAVAVAAPSSESGSLPTLDVRDVTVIEGNSSYEYARFLLVLDRPATAAVSGSYYFQDGNASSALGDYDADSGSFSFAAGQQTTWIATEVYGDIGNEGDETFDLVLTGLSNAVFAGEGAALVATATIADDDGGGTPTPGGIGDYSEPVLPASAESGSLPTLRIHDVSVVEGNSSYEYARFLVTLDRPATATVSFWYSINDGTASDALGDFDQDSRQVTIAAGTSSTWISTEVYGDTAIEGDEQFTIVLADIENAVFEGGAPALEATATIIDNDSGPISGAGGVGDPGRQIAAPLATSGVVMDVVDVSIAEGNSSYNSVYVYVLFSQPLTAPVTVHYETVGGTATSGEDYYSKSGTATFPAGTESSWFSISVRGDTAIEGDESFALRLSNLSGATFANGQMTMDATVLIRDNDGTGTAGDSATGPDFTYFAKGTASADILNGTNDSEVLDGLGGSDTIRGNGGNDRLIGGSGNDTLVGGSGIDSYDGGAGSDTVSFAGAAGWNIDLAAGTAVTLTGGTTERLTSIENVIGSNGNDTLTGTAYRNDLDGGGGDDMLIGGGGIDDYYGGAGFDTVDLSGGNSKWRVDLGAGTAELTTATGNVHSSDFEGIESVIGPRNSMTFIGTSGNEKATGSYFADIFYARGGVDEFHGGNGSDTVSFGNYGEGLTIRGTAGYARLGDGTQVTTFTGIENIFATSEDDDITGTAGNNTIVGRSGADWINGGSGDDNIKGDLGRDLITGGRGNDRIDGGSDPNDYAFYSGNQNQYNISTSAGGVTTVEWIGPGSGDGTDTLTNIEFLGFDDGFLHI